MTADAYLMDVSQWPLVMTSGQRLPQDEDVARLEAFGDEVLAREAPFAWLIEIGHGFALREPQRLRYSSWLTRHRHALARHCVAFCVVHPTLAGRTADRSIFLTSRPEYPYALFKTPLAGRLWCAARLAERGLEVPAVALTTLQHDGAMRMARRASEPTPALPLRAITRA